MGVQEAMLNLKFGSCSLHRRVSLSLFWLCVSSYLQQIFGKITKVSSLVSSFVIGITGEERIIQTFCSQKPTFLPPAKASGLWGGWHSLALQLHSLGNQRERLPPRLTSGRHQVPPWLSVNQSRSHFWRMLNPQGPLGPCRTSSCDPNLAPFAFQYDPRNICNV